MDYDLDPQDKWLLDKIPPTNSFDLLLEEDDGPLESVIKKKYLSAETTSNTYRSTGDWTIIWISKISCW